MKKKSFLSAIALLLSALVSCQKDSLYLQVPGTCWTLSNDSQDAYISFHDGTHVSVLQTAKEKALSKPCKEPMSPTATGWISRAAMALPST